MSWPTHHILQKKNIFVWYRSCKNYTIIIFKYFFQWKWDYVKIIILSNIANCIAIAIKWSMFQAQGAFFVSRKLKPWLKSPFSPSFTLSTLNPAVVWLLYFSLLIPRSRSIVFLMPMAALQFALQFPSTRFVIRLAALSLNSKSRYLLRRPWRSCWRSCWQTKT